MGWLFFGSGELTPGFVPVPRKLLPQLALKIMEDRNERARARGNTLDFPAPGLEQKVPRKHLRLKSLPDGVSALPPSFTASAALAFQLSSEKQEKIFNVAGKICIYSVRIRNI